MNWMIYLHGFQSFGQIKILKSSRSESSAQSPESSAHSLDFSVQGPASRVQRPESNIQSPAPRVQHPEFRVQCEESNVQHLCPESRNSGMPIDGVAKKTNPFLMKILRIAYSQQLRKER